MKKIIRTICTLSALSLLFGCSTNKVENSVQSATSTPTTTVKPVEKSTPIPPSTPEPSKEAVALGYPDQFNYSSVPAYSDSPYVEINGNVPYFSDDNISTVSYENYSDLDSLGRCGVATANVGKDLMPTEKRGSIGMIKPSGWHTVRYDDIIEDRYLYNRCHLIGYQLTGENANKKNLITGTRYLNVDGMLPFENKVADYVKSTGNHVLYRVTPIYEKSDDLVAVGVLMEAKSDEDDGKGVQFNVFCYNVQPGISINYATGDSALAGSPSTSNEEAATQPEAQQEEAPVEDKNETMVWIPNSGSKYHSRANCSNMKNPREVTIDQAISMGFTPCKKCW